MFDPVTDSPEPLSSKTPYPMSFETVSPVMVVGPLHAPERFTAPHPETRHPSTSTDVSVRPLPAVARTPATRSPPGVMLVAWVRMGAVPFADVFVRASPAVQ